MVNSVLQLQFITYACKNIILMKCLLSSDSLILERRTVCQIFGVLGTLWQPTIPDCDGSSQGFPGCFNICIWIMYTQLWHIKLWVHGWLNPCKDYSFHWYSIQAQFCSMLVYNCLCIKNKTYICGKRWLVRNDIILEVTPMEMTSSVLCQDTLRTTKKEDAYSVVKRI